MGKKTLTLSIVIPVYNEERYIKACLDSIAKQSVKPDEVIVVDNNSTDKSIEIARKYKFVKLFHEPRQHQSFAQKTGFGKARGDILGRIDGDVVLPVDWVESIKSYFSSNPSVVAISGGALPYDIHLSKVGAAIQRFYHNMSEFIAGHRLLWGTNCALRRSAWRKISNQVQLRPDIWEDFDMSFVLKNHGEIVRLKTINVGTSFRAVHKSVFEQTSYQFREVRTFYSRVGLPRTALLFLIWLTKYGVYPLILIDEHVLKRVFGRKSYGPESHKPKT